jgi:hypothetical protein
MRYILILLLFISGAASAQFAPTSAKTKFSNGIAIGSKDTSAFSAADTMVLTIARDSVMYYKYRGVWRPIATGGNLNNYKLISDTLFNNGYTTRARTKQYGDSIAALKLNISDTAAMLANRLKISDTLTMLSKLSLDRVLINGNTSGRGVVLGTGSFTSSGSSNTVEIAHSSGSGIALNITKGGNGEGLYVNKTSGSGNAATIIGTLNATALVKSGGTSSQFLMADGSVNTSVLPSGAYLPLSGGTLTGALEGTTVNFSGQGRFKGWYSVGGGHAVELGVSGTDGNIISYNRTTSSYQPLNIQGSTILFNQSTGGAITLYGSLNGTSAAFSGNIETQSRLLIQTSTSPTAQGQIGYGSDAGLYIWPKAGATFAYTLYSNTGNEVMRIPVGTINANFNGNVLVKTLTDNGTDALQVSGSGTFSSSVTAASLRSGATNTIGWVGHGGFESVTDGNFRLYNEARTVNGNLTLGAITASSSVTATGFIVSSSRTLKDIYSRSKQADGIDFVGYTWKKKLKLDSKKHLGFIAEEVEKVLPDAVFANEKGVKSVNYTEVLIYKLDNLSEKIKELELKIEKLEKKYKKAKK